MSDLEILSVRAPVEEPPAVLPLHLVVVTNFIAPHLLTGWLALDRRVKKLTILLSTEMEGNRPWQPEFGDLDVRIQRSTTIRKTWGRSLGFRDPNFVHLPWDTIRQLRELKPDVVISAELGFRTLMCAGHRMLAPQTPLIYWCGLSERTEHDRGWLRYVLRKTLLKHADCVMINGASGQRYLERMGVSSSRISRYSYATIPAVYEAGSDERSADAAHRLVYVGQLVQRKGVLPFTRALAAWAAAHQERSVEFWLIGSGPEEQAIRQLSIPANLQLHLPGQCDYATIIEFLGEAGILAFPSLADEWGLAVNEAMAAGLPVLGSIYSQAVDELIDHGVNGWTFRTDVPSEMEQAIDAALNTPPEQLDRMRSAARRSVKDLTPEKTADDTVAAICAAMGRDFNQLVASASDSNPRRDR